MLYARHAQQVAEMNRRGYNHRSPLPDYEHQPEPFAYTPEDSASDLKTLLERQEVKV
jgi:hypothetical protein